MREARWKCFSASPWWPCGSTEQHEAIEAGGSTEEQGGIDTYSVRSRRCAAAYLRRAHRAGRDAAGYFFLSAVTMPGQACLSWLDQAPNSWWPLPLRLVCSEMCSLRRPSFFSWLTRRTVWVRSMRS